MLLKNKKILILGAKGFLAKNLIQELKRKEIKFSYLEKNDCDLLNFSKSLKIIKKKKPDIIFNCAGKVGGIKYNLNNSSEIFYENIQMLTNILKISSILKIKKLINIGSSCCYPSNIKRKLNESDLFRGELHPSVEAYGFWKLSSIIGARAFHKDTKLKTINLIFPSLYGPLDKFDPENSHVISSLIAKFAKAVKLKKKEIELWGSGKPIREFIFVEDAVEILMKFSLKYNSIEPINIGIGKGYRIKQIANIISKIYNFNGKIIWNKNKPDGQKQKILDNSKLKKITAWRPKTSIYQGLLKTVNWYNSKKT